MLEPLASAEALAARLGLEADDQDVIDAVNAASARFRDAVEHPVSRIKNDAVTLDGDGTRYLYLPAFPVTIKSIVVSDVTLDETGFQVSSRHGIIRRVFGCWPDEFDAVTITYDHGFDPTPDGIAQAVLDVAEASYAAVAGAGYIQVGGESVTFGGGGSAASGGGTTEGWRNAVARYGLGTRDRV